MYRFQRATRDHLTISTMYAPPPPEIIAKLVGQIVEMISFGSYVFHLSFENRDRLSVTCPFRFDTGEAIAESPIFVTPLSESNMIRLVGSSVVHAECESDGTLLLQFSNDDVLIAYANDPGYEAYSLSLDGKEYIV